MTWRDRSSPKGVRRFSTVCGHSLAPALTLAVALLASAPARGAQAAVAPSAAPVNQGATSEPVPGDNRPGSAPAGRTDLANPPGQSLTAPVESAAALPPWANRGRWTLGFQLGYALENGFPRNVSHVSLLIAQPQLGLIVWDSSRQRLLVDRFEVLSEGILGDAVHPGGRLLGETVLFRLDGQPRHAVVPFLDAGAGALHTTLDQRAPELDGHVQFTPQAGLGIQYFFTPQRALVFEYRYMHMSNADLVPPNLGFNSSMITIGFRWLRRPARDTAFQGSGRATVRRSPGAPGSD